MNLKILYITLGILSTELLAAQNQTMEMSLEQVVKIARLESPDARTARHSFRSAYWNYKYYRANYLPSLSLSSDPRLPEQAGCATRSRQTLLPQCDVPPLLLHHIYNVHSRGEKKLSPSCAPGRSHNRSGRH